MTKYKVKAVRQISAVSRELYLVLFGNDCVELLLVVEHLYTLGEDSLERGWVIGQLSIVLVAP